MYNDSCVLSLWLRSAHQNRHSDETSPWDGEGRADSLRARPWQPPKVGEALQRESLDTRGSRPFNALLGLAACADRPGLRLRVVQRTEENGKRPHTRVRTSIRAGSSRTGTRSPVRSSSLRQPVASGSRYARGERSAVGSQDHEFQFQEDALPARPPVLGREPDCRKVGHTQMQDVSPRSEDRSQDPRVAARRLNVSGYR